MHVRVVGCGQNNELSEQSDKLVIIFKEINAPCNDNEGI